MLWRFRDREHPGFEPDLARDYATLIEEHYARCDKLLGPVLDNSDENTLLMVLSDHGFNTFRRAFDTNTWLSQNGLLALKNGTPAPGSDESFHGVDWSRTYAYAVGLGGIYLNMKGREREGILEEGSTEAERVRNAIQARLPEIVDSQTNSQPVRSVSRREELYCGAYTANAPELLVNFSPGFRVSWKSAVGGFAESLIEDNTRRWSGDHIIDPTNVAGILFLNRNGRASLQPAFEKNETKPNIIDLAPAILNYLGVPVPKTMEGTPLF
jgi:predicted AlkP superfamily phosphohydrolase/phosphomutase